MGPANTPRDLAGVLTSLSAPRLQAYVDAAAGDHARALALYAWNAQISAALMLPAHFAEVATRNAAADALDAVYGPRWPWASNFELSLPATGPYSPRRDLIATRTRQRTTGHVIAELKFVFWEKLFTRRHDQRLWAPRIQSLFPAAPATLTAPSLRLRIAEDLAAIRTLRNRIAHHEPIHARTLKDDLERMLDLVELRSATTAAWVRQLETVTDLLARRP